MNTRLTPAFLIVGSLLTACNGGGGNSGMTPAPVQFTSFSAVQNGQSVPANGFSQTMTIGPFATTLDPVNTANSTAQFTYINIGTATPVISAFSFSTPTSSAGFAGIPIDCTSVAGECSALGTNSLGKVINALDSSVGWNYQTFGYWLVNLSTVPLAGAMSFGSPTPVSGIPISGNATYAGRSGGAYVDPTGNVFTYRGTMLSSVDFAARTIGFSVNPTLITPVSTAVLPPPLSALGVTGILTYTSASSQFSGLVTAPGATGTVPIPNLIGTATGQFYGPVAQEIGGVLSLKVLGSQETMVGGFGGKK